MMNIKLIHFDVGGFSTDIGEIPVPSDVERMIREAMADRKLNNKVRLVILEEIPVGDLTI